jgi:hypothetical protein
MLDFLKREKEEISLLIDIGNGSITGALVLFSIGSLPKILYNTKKSFSAAEKSDAPKLLSDMAETLEEILKNITTDGLGSALLHIRNRRLAHVMISLHSPWFMSKTKHINISKDTPFIISKAFVKDITEKEEKIFEDELTKDYTLEKGDSFEILEKSVVNAKINGYTLRDSIGKTTNFFDAFLFISVTGEKIIGKVYDVILKYTHIPKEKILVHTFPLASFSVVRDIFENTKDFLLVDIAAEATDITLVQNDVIVHGVVLPSGRNFILREIAKKFNTPLEVAESTLRLYKSDKIDNSTIEAIQEILVNIEREWAIYLENALIELSPSIILPSRVYITSDDDVAQIFMDFIKLSKTDATSLFRKNVDIIRINEETLKSFLDKNSAPQVEEAITILVTFYNKLKLNDKIK